MKRIANKNAREFTTRRETFTGSNLYAVDRYGVYVVYSYGEHFPLFAYVRGTWFENADKYSPSTTRHKFHARPYTYGAPIKLTTRELRGLIG